MNLILIDWKQAQEKRKVVVAVFLDFKRAFETIDREILCKVLEGYGIKGTVLKWFRSWLSSRRQYTRFGDASSASTQNDYGVPQGTPLSCLMFILYINSFVNVPLYCNISLFADDTLLWVTAENLEDAIMMINSDLERITSFLKMLKLKLNVKKTKAMIINDRRGTTFDIVVEGETIEIVQSMKYLGVIVDYKLTFAENVEHIAKKISKKVSLMARIKSKTDRETRLTLFKTIVTPHVDFCSTILLLATDTQIHQLQLLMNKALRIIENGDRRALLDIKQRIYYNVLMLIYRAQNLMLPDYICRHFKLLSETQPYQLRTNHHLRPPTCTSGALQNSFMYKGAMIYNDMIQKTKVDANASETEYRKAVKTYVKNNIFAHRLL